MNCDQSAHFKSTCSIDHASSFMFLPSHPDFPFFLKRHPADTAFRVGPREKRSGKIERKKAGTNSADTLLRQLLGTIVSQKMIGNTLAIRCKLCHEDDAKSINGSEQRDTLTHYPCCNLTVLTTVFRLKTSLFPENKL